MLPYPESEFKAFFELHQHDDPTALILSAKGDKKTIGMVEQLRSRNKIRKKLPEWFARYDLHLPPEDNLSQSSSSITAAFKSRYVEGSLLDLTLGSGIDMWKMSKMTSSCAGVEPNEDLAARTAHNFKQLDVECPIYITTAEAFLAENQDSYGTIYIDPSRRTEDGKKTVALHRMVPDIGAIWTNLLQSCNRLIVKLSPLFDLTAIQNELKDVVQIDVVSVNGEVKEILVIAEKDNDRDCLIQCVELEQDGESLIYSTSSPINIRTDTSEWKAYLYDPSSGLIKSNLDGAWAFENGLTQPIKDVRLYTSDRHLPSFPGRIFAIKEVSKPYKISKLPQRLSIVSRSNYERSEQIRKKLKVGESEIDFLFAAGKSKKERVFIYAMKVS